VGPREEEEEEEEESLYSRRRECEKPQTSEHTEIRIKFEPATSPV
jgi:hypothetical protein